MTWFKVDDKLHDHHKTHAAKKAAMGVWVLAGSWSADNLTDGFIPARVLNRWGTKTDADRLVEVGLWTPTERKGERGWQFHEWTERQPSRADIERVAETKGMAGARGNHTRWHKRKGVSAPDCQWCQEEIEVKK
jgi:hypothetical protein